MTHIAAMTVAMSNTPRVLLEETASDTVGHHMLECVEKRRADMRKERERGAGGGERAGHELSVWNWVISITRGSDIDCDVC